MRSFIWTLGLACLTVPANLIWIFICWLLEVRS